MWALGGRLVAGTSACINVHIVAHALLMALGVCLPCVRRATTCAVCGCGWLVSFLDLKSNSFAGTTSSPFPIGYCGLHALKYVVLSVLPLEHGVVLSLRRWRVRSATVCVC